MANTETRSRWFVFASSVDRSAQAQLVAAGITPSTDAVGVFSLGIVNWTPAEIASAFAPYEADERITLYAVQV